MGVALERFISGKRRSKSPSQPLSVADFEDVAYNAGHMQEALIDDSRAEEIIARDKYAKYVRPLVASFEKVPQEKIEFGDIYLSHRSSGLPLTITPLYVNDWSTEQGFRKDWLLIFAFDQNRDIVGTRSVYHVFKGEKVNTKGFISSAVCNDGIASAVESVRRSVFEELLGKYHNEGLGKNKIVHQIEDDNKVVLNKLLEKTQAKPTDIFVAKRYEHALSDRPRWEALFAPNSETGVRKNSTIVTRSRGGHIQRGFSAPQQDRSAISMNKIMNDSGSTWEFADLGREVRDQFEEQGLFDKQFLLQAFRESIDIQPLD